RSAQAEAELTALTLRFEEIDPKPHKDVAAAVFPATMVPEPLRGFVGAFTAILMAAVFMVLVIACANAANLMLARAVARRREMAVRASMGASRFRLARQSLTESIVLGFSGGALGLLMTMWSVPVLLRLTPPSLPLRPEIRLDICVFLFTGLVSILTGIIFGFAPAWQGARVNVASALKDQSPTGGSKRSPLASAMIIGQIAVCMVLLIAGALCLRSLFNAQHVDLGFKIQNRIMAEVSLKNFGYTQEQIDRFNDSFLERVATLTGIESVALADYLQLDTRVLGFDSTFEGREPPPGQDGFQLQTFNVGPNFFATMGTSLLQGREFRPGDRAGAPPVIIINQTMAEKFWPGENPVGRHVTRGKGDQLESFEIVGVVETGKYRTLGEGPQPVVFRSRLQERGARSTFVAHIRGDARSAMMGMQKVVQGLDTRLALNRLGTLEQHLALALFPARDRKSVVEG